MLAEGTCYGRWKPGTRGSPARSVWSSCQLGGSFRAGLHGPQSAMLRHHGHDSGPCGILRRRSGRYAGSQLKGRIGLICFLSNFWSQKELSLWGVRQVSTGSQIVLGQAAGSLLGCSSSRSRIRMVGEGFQVASRQSLIRAISSHILKTECRQRFSMPATTVLPASFYTSAVFSVILHSICRALNFMPSSAECRQGVKYCQWWQRVKHFH